MVELRQAPVELADICWNAGAEAMDSDTVAWITETFVEVDPRFINEWEIPFGRVQRAFHRLDSYWERHPGVPRTGLVQLCAPGAGDYYLTVRDIAQRAQRARASDAR